MSEKQAPIELIRIREAARLLSVSEWFLRKLAHEGQLAYIQHTDRSPMLFDLADIRKWIERAKIHGNGK
jgi:excisionase family DNA binding protein